MSMPPFTGSGVQAPLDPYTTAKAIDALVRMATALELISARLAAGARGCMCPTGAEQTCQGLTCPRRPPLRRVPGGGGGTMGGGMDASL